MGKLFLTIKRSQMLFWFVCLWWNFSEWEFREKRRNSGKMPVFVVCYSRHCAHCSGLPEGTVQFAQGEGNRSDVYITMLDCAVQPLQCRHFGVTGTPHMVLMIGEKKRYWPRIHSKKGEDWNKFIDSYVTPSLREIVTDEELAEAVREHAGGGTTFHLETPDAEHEMVKELRALSKEFRIYDDVFTFRLNGNIDAPELTAYGSPVCHTRYFVDVRGVREFVEENMFGFTHQYDSDEYKVLQKRKKKTLLVFVQKEIKYAQKLALRHVIEGQCKDIVVGWVSVDESKKLASKLHVKASDLPITVYNDPVRKCRVVTRIRTAELVSSGFLEAAEKGTICGKEFIPSSQHHTWEDTQTRITGFSLTMGYFGLLFSLIAVIRLFTGNNHKLTE